MLSKSKVYFLSDEAFRNLVERNITYSDCLREIGLSTNGAGSSALLKKRIKELNISTEHFDSRFHRSGCAGKKYIKPISSYLTKNPKISIKSLRIRIIKEKVIPYVCAICGNNGVWEGRELVLHLDHINGDNTDNRLENIRFLCPNCHSQTDTYAGRNVKKVSKPLKICLYCRKLFNPINKKQKFCSIDCRVNARRKVIRPSLKQIYADLEEHNNNYCAVARKYGVSDNSIRKWIKAYKKHNN